MDVCQFWVLWRPSLSLRLVVAVRSNSRLGFCTLYKRIADFPSSRRGVILKLVLDLTTTTQQTRIQQDLPSSGLDWSHISDIVGPLTIVSLHLDYVSLGNLESDSNALRESQSVFVEGSQQSGDV